MDTGGKYPGDAGYVKGRVAHWNEGAGDRLVDGNNDDSNGGGTVIKMPAEEDDGGWFGWKSKVAGEGSDKGTASADADATSGSGSNSAAAAAAAAAAGTAPAANAATAADEEAAAAGKDDDAVVDNEGTNLKRVASEGNLAKSVMQEGAVQLQRMIEYMFAKVATFNLVEFLDKLEYLSEDAIPFVQYVMAMALLLSSAFLKSNISSICYIAILGYLQSENSEMGLRRVQKEGHYVVITVGSMVIVHVLATLRMPDVVMPTNYCVDCPTRRFWLNFGECQASHEALISPPPPPFPPPPPSSLLYVNASAPVNAAAAPPPPGTAPVISKNATAVGLCRLNQFDP
jgi:hypothetical protein